MKPIYHAIKGILIISAFIISVVISAILWIVSQFPSDSQITGCITTKMYQVRLCSKDENYVKLSRISPFLIKAVVLSEDSAFWEHGGFDINELQKSLEKNMRTGKFVRGGSTITQQLAKNMFLTKEKTLIRKIKEAIIAFRLEKKLKKRDILEKYLNVIQFGKDLFGIQKAAQFYFKKSPADLSLIEAAYLTYLLPSPEKYSQSYFKGELTPFGRKRINQIVDNLYLYQRITETEYQAAKFELSSFLRKDSGPNEIPTLEIPDEEEIIEED